MSSEFFKLNRLIRGIDLNIERLIMKRGSCEREVKENSGNTERYQQRDGKRGRRICNFDLTSARLGF
jgi:hypothetical protein